MLLYLSEHLMLLTYFSIIILRFNSFLNPDREIVYKSVTLAVNKMTTAVLIIIIL